MKENKKIVDISLFINYVNAAVKEGKTEGEILVNLYSMDSYDKLTRWQLDTLYEYVKLQFASSGKGDRTLAEIKNDKA